MSNKLMIFGSDRKDGGISSFGGKDLVWNIPWMLENWIEKKTILISMYNQ